jgi:thiol-disulfide isomerase/thioredoxin
MRKSLSSILIGAGLIILSLAMWIWWRHAPGKGEASGNVLDANCVEPASVSFPSPDLELKDLEDRQVSLGTYQGKVILLNAWATWCPPCIAEMPDLEEYYRRYQDQNFIIIGVNVGEKPETVRSFLTAQGISFPIWLDPNESVLRALNSMSLPNSIVIDQAGVVRLAWQGKSCIQALETRVTPLLD